MDNVEKKTYSENDIKRIAPGYRGKPENFDPTKVGKKQSPKLMRRNPRNAPRRAPTIEPPAPANLQTKETAQRNKSIISESIFGVDVSITEIAPRQSFAANYAKVVDVGIAGDMLMAVASAPAEPIPNFHVGKPANSEITNNLVGKFYPIGPRRPEIAQR
ncbi:hypothetical protein ABEB36_011107 [Hypothenemus hampei]|uniref:Uncharacterized protein n=1 Tax=Hypothenemus hampei TaxID=57062 RepID=A0ABD1EEV6_HYPHA